MTGTSGAAVDSSVVVAAFAPWHNRHADASAVVRRTTLVPAHALLEAYSVLTRLPPPFRMPPSTVREYLERTFPAENVLTLPPERQATLVGDVERAGVSGGATYDAVIALTAESGGATLMTLDTRALRTYDRCGVGSALVTKGS